jgi:hypothetical protein
MWPPVSGTPDPNARLRRVIESQWRDYCRIQRFVCLGDWPPHTAQSSSDNAVAPRCEHN